MTTPSHSAEAEEESLKLVEDFNNELKNALDSLSGVKPSSLIDTYRFWWSKHLHGPVAEFAFLVRPAIEMAFRFEAARQHPDVFYRIAHEEHRQDKHLRQGRPELLAQNEKNWEKFENAVVNEFPKVTIPYVDEKLTIEQVAKKAGMTPFYNSHYRIYCRYTHGALQANTGNIDKVTDRADNRTMAICSLVALNNLISFGAKSPNRDRLAQRLENITPRGDST